MRTLNRAMILVTFAIAGCAHSRKPSPTPPPATNPTTKPVAIQPTTKPKPVAVATRPVTRPATLPMAVVPTSAPATLIAEEAPTAPPFVPASQPTDPAEIEANAAMAEHLASLAQSALPTKVPSNDLWNPILREMAAMLTAAVKLDPTNARIARLAVEPMTRLNDDDGTIAALKVVRAADPADEFTQVQLLDLYTGRMETTSAKLEYLQGVLGHTTLVPASVRSHAAVLCAKLMLERGETQSAAKLLKQAIVLNPINSEALHMHYDMLPPNTSSFERVEGLLSILKSNPAQAGYAAQLGDQLAANGLVEDSIPWFRTALSLSAISGKTDLNSGRSLAVEMLLNDQVSQAAVVTNQLIRVEPENPDNWFLELAVFHFAGSKDDFSKALQAAGNVMSNRLIEDINTLAAPGTPPATTRPIDAEGSLTLPDLSLTVAQLNQAGTAEQKAKFVSAVSDLAMVEIYFAAQGDASSRLLDALSAILPSDSPQVIRLSGWADLVAGRTDQARTKLSSAPVKNDVLAQLGLIKLTAMNPSDLHQAANAGRQLISQHPSGLIAAIVWDGLKGLDPKIVTTGQADLVKQQIDTLPKTWLKILDEPQGFYGVHVEPLDIARAFGEPLLAVVTIQNLTDTDLTIGPDGTIKRGLWFSATVRGPTEQSFGGIVFDQIAGPLVLAARHHATQVIRLDQGPLLALLNSDPTISMDVYGTVATNPTAGPKGSLMPGPSGYTVQFANVFSRRAEPPSGPDAQQAVTDLDDGTPIQKIRAIQLLARYIEIISSSKEANDQAKQFQAACYQSIYKARNDASPSVSAWAGFVLGAMSDPTAKATLLREMSDDPDWLHRLVALVLANGADLKLHKEIALKLAADPEPSVRALAAASEAMVEVAATLPASTEPSTTQPSTTQP